MGKSVDSWLVIKRVLMVFLLVSAGALIANSLYQNFAALREYLYQVDISLMLFAVLLYCGALGCQGLYNTWLIFERSQAKHSLWLMLREYFASKLVRYIPGKVWGIYYQSERLKNVAPRRIVWMSNLVQFIDANIFSCVVMVVALLAYFVGSFFSAVGLVVCCIFFILYMKSGVIETIVLLLARQTGLKVNYPSLIGSNELVIKRLLLIVIDWVFYLGVWLVISMNYLSVPESVGLAILYAGASLIGVMVVVVPSGLFVREASFITLAVWFGHDETLATFLGIVARLVLTLSDVVLGLLFSLIARKSMTEVEAYEY